MAQLFSYSIILASMDDHLLFQSTVSLSPLMLVKVSPFSHFCHFQFSFLFLLSVLLLPLDACFLSMINHGIHDKIKRTHITNYHWKILIQSNCYEPERTFIFNEWTIMSNLRSQNLIALGSLYCVVLNIFLY